MESHTSYGRGGAGNLRRKSEVQSAEEYIKNNPSEPSTRRRSSVWSTSGSSSSSRRQSIVEAITGAFRRNSKIDEEAVKE